LLRISFLGPGFQAAEEPGKVGVEGVQFHCIPSLWEDWRSLQAKVEDMEGLGFDWGSIRGLFLLRRLAGSSTDWKSVYSDVIDFLDSMGKLISNFSKLVILELAPAPKLFHGQFIQMDVVEVAEAK
jgi:hypothetical protein